jgi:predicted dehydrogenase
MTNLGQHLLDVVHWYLDAKGPRSVSSGGGRFTLRDNGETPDVQDARFDYANWFATWSHRECSRGASPWRGLEFCGTRGSLTISRQGFFVTPDPLADPENAIPQFGGPHPVGGPRQTATRPAAGARTTAIADHSGNDLDQFRRHARNFIDCVRSRQEPAASLESAHRVVTACHLANLSLRLNRTLRWDAESESVIGDPEAQALLVRPYRAPWDAVKKALLEV